MKVKRTVIIVSAVAAVLCVGIGFAAINDTLTVSGNVSVGVTGIAEVKFVEDIDVDYSGTRGTKSGVGCKIENESSAEDDEDDKLSITVPAGVLLAKNDKIVITGPITNISETYDAEVTLQSAASQASGLYSVTCRWQGGASSTETIVRNGGSKTAEIEIKLLENPTDEVDNNKFTIKYTAEVVSN